MLRPEVATRTESCGKHYNNTVIDDDVDLDTVLEELSIDYDEIENNISGSMNDLNENSLNSAVPCCAICLDKFDIGDDISKSMDTTKCHHEYHTLCITEWLMKHPNCPYCRRNYIPLPPPKVTESEVPVVTDTEITTEAATAATADTENEFVTIPNTDLSETAALPVPRNTVLPSQRTPPLTSTPPPSQINPRIRTFGILLTSFWRRDQQQQLRPPDNVDIESGMVSTSVATQPPQTATNSSTTTNDSNNVDRAHDDDFS